MHRGALCVSGDIGEPAAGAMLGHIGDIFISFLGGWLSGPQRGSAVGRWGGSAAGRQGGRAAGQLGDMAVGLRLGPRLRLTLAPTPTLTHC